MGYHGGGGALVLFHEGQQVCDGTERSLTSDSAVIQTLDVTGSFALVVDVSPLDATTGDQVRFFLRNAAQTGDPVVIDVLGTVTAPDAPTFRYFELDLGIDWDLTMIKLAGTSRTLSYSIWRRP